MSLINDALKRAKQAQSETPTPASDLHLRPVEPSPYRRHGLGLMVPVSLGVVALLVLFLVWEWSRDGGAPVRARQIEPTPSAEPAKPMPHTFDTATQPQPVTPAATSAPGLNSTNSPAVVAAPEPEKPPPLKLQGIIFNPGRPSAVISSRILFPGDRIREFKVTTITRNSVTLVSTEQKVVLNLEQ